MKKSFIGLLTLIVAMSFTSCVKTYYQVSTTKAVNPGQFASVKDGYVYEDSNVKIMLDMWDENGKSTCFYQITSLHFNEDAEGSACPTAEEFKELVKDCPYAKNADLSFLDGTAVKTTTEPPTEGTTEKPAQQSDVFAVLDALTVRDARAASAADSAVGQCSAAAVDQPARVSEKEDL